MKKIKEDKIRNKRKNEKDKEERILKGKIDKIKQPDKKFEESFLFFFFFSPVPEQPNT